MIIQGSHFTEMDVRGRLAAGILSMIASFIAGFVTGFAVALIVWFVVKMVESEAANHDDEEYFEP